MRVIDRETVAALMTPALALEAVRSGFLQLHHQQVVVPDEFVMHHPTQGDVHIKGAYLHDAQWMVAKVATAGFAIPGNGGAVMAINAESGQIDFVVDDGGLLTELRTAAAVALTVDLLARANSTRLGIIGAGVQAQFQLAAVKPIRPFTDVGIYSRTYAKAETLAQQGDLRAYHNLAELLQWADVVLIATTSNEPIVVDVAQLRPGAHITTSGADMVGKRELALAVVNEVDVVAVDDLALARRVGLLQPDGVVAVERGVLTVGKLVAGAPGRTTDTHITVAGLVGLGVQDAAIFGALLNQL
jgi:ornithine cyclodeaminase/alanine dehydrogenase-like protein (mu-crystallin family)